MKTVKLFYFLAICIFYQDAFSGAFTENEALNLTPDDIKTLRSTGNEIVLDGKVHYLLGDVLYAADSIGIKGLIGTRWTNGTLFYEYSDEVAANPTWMNQFEAACRLWSDVVPNIRCLPRSNEPNYVEVRTHSNSCSSYVMGTGMQSGRQILSISKGVAGRCYNHWGDIGIIAHEIGHEFGFVHEQSRWDRASYVNIMYNNLRDRNPSTIYQFRIISSTINTTYTPYDFNSIMHYHDSAFARPSSGLKTIVPSICYEGIVGHIGSQGSVTSKDALELKHHYGLPIYAMLKKVRNSSCGTERLNAAERKHFCVDLGENCGDGMNSPTYSGAITNHKNSYCPGAMHPICSGTRGSRFSCCTVQGMAPFNVYHWRGSRSCSLGTRRKHNVTWSCGCEGYEVNARCSNSTNGFNLSVIQDYVNGEDPKLKSLGMFVHYLMQLMDQGVLDSSALIGAENLLIQDFDFPHYYQSLDEIRRKVALTLHASSTRSQNSISMEKIESIYNHVMNVNSDCEERKRIRVSMNKR